MNLFVDIETIPSQDDSLRALLAAEIKVPGQYKKPESIAEWEREQKPALVEEALSKTGLDGAFGRICVIGWAIDDDEPQTLHSADDEKGLLRAFGDALGAIAVKDWHTTAIVGHNVASFDLRFLAQRSIVHGIRPHMVISRAAQAKPWEQEKVFDTMVQWAGVGNRISLDKLCRALGIPSPKGEIDGSQVWEYVKSGRIAEVAEYCKRDVIAARAVHQRMTFRAPVAVEALEDVPA